MSAIERAHVDLLDAIDRLTNPVRVPRGQGLREATARSLWQVLLLAIERGSGSGSGSASGGGSTAPVSMDCFELAARIHREVVTELRAANTRLLRRRQERADELAGGRGLACAVRPPSATGRVPADLRRLARLYRNDPVRAAALAERVRGWVREIPVAARLDPPLPTALRIACLHCGARTVLVPDGREMVRRWALSLVWDTRGPVPRVRLVRCESCLTELPAQALGDAWLSSLTGETPGHTASGPVSAVPRLR